MGEDDPPDHPLIRWAQVVAMRLNRLEPLSVQPVLGFSIALPAMDMNGFIPFVSVEEETPAKYYQDCRHLPNLKPRRTVIEKKGDAATYVTSF